MTREEVFERLNEVFRDVFDDETIKVKDTTTADDIEDWDSLEHINLVVAVEKCFGIKFTMGEVTGMKNVGAMADIILEKAFLKLGYEVEFPAAFDSLRDITITFLRNGYYRVELIEPLGPNSPVYGLLKKYKNTPYHFCYEVTDLEEAVAELEAQGYYVIQAPLEAPCIEKRRVVFLMGADMGMIEVVEMRDKP